MKSIWKAVLFYGAIFGLLVLSVNYFAKPVVRENANVLAEQAKLKEAQPFEMDALQLDEKYGNLEIKNKDILNTKEGRRGNLVFTGEVLLEGVIDFHEETENASAFVSFTPNKESLTRLPQEKGKDKVTIFFIYNQDLAKELYGKQNGKEVEVLVTELSYRYAEWGMDPLLSIVPMDMDESMKSAKKKAESSDEVYYYEKGDTLIQ